MSAQALDKLTELVTGDWLEERHDGTPDRCVFCYGESDGGKANHKPTCPQQFAAEDLAALRAQLAAAEGERDAARSALKDVMEWIGGWTPDFTDDDAWGETEAKAAAALAGAQPAAQGEE